MKVKWGRVEGGILEKYELGSRCGAGKEDRVKSQDEDGLGFGVGVELSLRLGL